MKISPIDIMHKSFGKKMLGGLDAEEVSDFLQAVAHQMETVLHERNALKETLREKELRLSEYKERDQVLQATITTANQMAERYRQDAEREAQLILTDAHQKAEGIGREARESLRGMYQEVTELKRMRMQFESNLKAMAQAHLSMIDQSEKYMPQMQLPNHHMTSNDKTAGISPLAVE